MTVYRLTTEEFASDLSGEGASRFGYRWNSRGIPMLYTSQSRSLAVLEVLVHIDASVLPENLVLVELEISGEGNIEELNASDLPSDWRELPFPKTTQHAGDVFLQKNKKQLLKVPSIIIPEEYNILLNPLHSGAQAIRIRSISPFSFDKRLFSRV